MSMHIFLTNHVWYLQIYSPSSDIYMFYFYNMYIPFFHSFFALYRGLVPKILRLGPGKLIWLLVGALSCYGVPV